MVGLQVRLSATSDSLFTAPSNTAIYSVSCPRSLWPAPEFLTHSVPFLYLCGCRICPPVCSFMFRGNLLHCSSVSDYHMRCYHPKHPLFLRRNTLNLFVSVMMSYLLHFPTNLTLNYSKPKIKYNSNME